MTVFLLKLKLNNYFPSVSRSNALVASSITITFGSRYNAHNSYADAVRQRVQLHALPPCLIF